MNLLSILGYICLLYDYNCIYDDISTNPTKYLIYTDPSDLWNYKYYLGLALCICSQLFFEVTHGYILHKHFYINIINNF